MSFIFVCFLFQSIIAQEGNQLFSRVDLSGGVLINSNRNLIHQYWKPGKGLFFVAGSPFYFGNIEAGLYFIPYKHKTTDIPEYANYFFFLGFSKEAALPLNLSIKSGIRFGSVFFQFSDNALSEYESIESEFAAGIFASGKLRIYKGFNLNASADYVNIFTNRSIRLVFISAGLGYNFNMPVWLREFLK